VFGKGSPPARNHEMLWGRRALYWIRPHGATPIPCQFQDNQSGIQGQANIEETSLLLALAHDLISTLRTDAEAVVIELAAFGPPPRHTCVCIW
jgi:hypothetical protein